MAVVLDDPEVAPATGPTGRRRRPWFVRVAMRALLVLPLAAASTWYGNRVDPFERPGPGLGSSGITVRTGAVQGFMVAFLTADKAGRLDSFEISELPAGARVVDTKVFFLDAPDAPRVALPFGCLPNGLNRYGLEDPAGTVPGRFRDVKGARFDAGDVVQLIAYVELGREGYFDLGGEVLVRYDIGPFAKSSSMRGSTLRGQVSDDAYPAGLSRGPDCQMANETRGGA